MKHSAVRGLIKVIIAVPVILLVAIVGGRKIQQHNLEQQVMTVLADDDRMARLNAIARLRDTHGPETLAVLVKALDDPDPKTHIRAGSELSLFWANAGDVAPALAEHLKTSPYPEVRLSCAILLMSHKSPISHDAYLHALRDSSEHVVQIACMEVAANSGPGDADALYALLNHPSWHVRLEACKALIVMKKADSRVVSTLEEMSHDPEAARYDADIEEFDRRDKEAGTPDEMKGMWGKLATILSQAQQIAGNR